MQRMFGYISGTTENLDRQRRLYSDNDIHDFVRPGYITNNIERILYTVKSISNDVEDLAKYLKGNASAMKKLQSIQESLNNQIYKALKQEKNKNALKQANLNELEAAMKQFEKHFHRKKVQHLLGKCCQCFCCLIALWGIICPILYQFGIIKV